jgi:hypothetical protein
MTRSMTDAVKEWSRADMMIRELNDRELDGVVGGNFDLHKIYACSRDQPNCSGL